MTATWSQCASYLGVEFTGCHVRRALTNCLQRETLRWLAGVEDTDFVWAALSGRVLCAARTGEVRQRAPRPPPSGHARHKRLTKYTVKYTNILYDEPVVGLIAIRLSSTCLNIPMCNLFHLGTKVFVELNFTPLGDWHGNKNTFTRQSAPVYREAWLNKGCC